MAFRRAFELGPRLGSQVSWSQNLLFSIVACSLAMCAALLLALCLLSVCLLACLPVGPIDWHLNFVRRRRLVLMLIPVGHPLRSHKVTSLWPYRCHLWADSLFLQWRCFFAFHRIFENISLPWRKITFLLGFEGKTFLQVGQTLASKILQKAEQNLMRTTKKSSPTTTCFAKSIFSHFNVHFGRGWELQIGTKFSLGLGPVWTGLGTCLFQYYVTC